MEGVQNASMEFDLDTLKPTFRLSIGLPGRSNAIAIAQRLGMPEDIVNEARSEIRPEELQVDDLLDEIRLQKDLAYRSRVEAEQQREAAEKLRKELLERLARIEDERAQILEKAQETVDRYIADLKEEIKNIRKKDIFSKDEIIDATGLEAAIGEIEAEFAIQPDRSNLKKGIEIQREIESGDSVRHRKLDTRGVVTMVERDEAEIQVGSLRVRANLADLEFIETEEGDPVSITGRAPAEKGKIQILKETPHPSPGIEINLRGQRSDEAINELERYLDSAYLAGLPFVRIIHGKGTGKLRQVIREYLSQNPNVKSFQSGGHNEGGEGVTVAKLDV